MESPDLSSFADLYGSIARGTASPDEMSRFVEQVKRPVIALLCWHGVDEGELDDAFAEIAFALVKSAHRLKESSKTGAFIAGLVRNHAMSVFRARKRRNANEMTVDFSVSETADGQGCEQLSSMIDSSEPEENIATTDRLSKYLANIPPDYGTCIKMKFYDGLSIADLSKILGISESLVKVRIHRGKEWLRRKLGGTDER